MPFDVNVVARDGRWYLGFATAARNVGAGALRIQGQGDGSGTMAVRQVSQDGAQVLNPSVGILRYVATVTHQHWHYIDFMRYELRGVDHPSVLHDQKQGFCLGDAPLVPGRPRVPPRPARLPASGGRAGHPAAALNRANAPG